MPAYESESLGEKTRSAYSTEQRLLGPRARQTSRCDLCVRFKPHIHVIHRLITSLWLAMAGITRLFLFMLVYCVYSFLFVVFSCIFPASETGHTSTGNHSHHEDGPCCHHCPSSPAALPPNLVSLPSPQSAASLITLLPFTDCLNTASSPMSITLLALVRGAVTVTESPFEIVIVDAMISKTVMYGCSCTALVLLHGGN